jgi:uncharacterized lipoprotein YmbA
MRTMFLAAATVAALSGSTSATYTLEAKTTARANAAQTASALQENPTDIPSYLMRQDGLMTNGLLPANGWQG